MAGSALIEMFGGIILGFTRNVAENYNPNEMEFGLEKEYGDNGSQGILNACSLENHEENIREPDWGVRYACVVCLLSSHISLAGPAKNSVAAKIQWSKTISECTETVFIHFWFSVKALFFFRSYQS